MPLYSQLIVALPGCSKEALVTMCRRHAKLILDNGGVVRGIENHGVRPLPARAKRYSDMIEISICDTPHLTDFLPPSQLVRKYPTENGERYFVNARFITATFDANPKLLVDVERLLKGDEGVLRFYTSKTKNNIDKSRGLSFRNPYLKIAQTLPESSS